MNLLRRKSAILVIAVIVLLIIVGLGYKLFSLYSFNTFSKELNTENQNLFDSFKDEVKTSNEIEQNIVKSMNFGLSFSKETNTSPLNQAKSDFDKSLEDYKSGVAELESKTSDITGFNKMPLWLGSDQKKFSSDISAAVENYVDARKEEPIPGKDQTYI